MSKTESGFQLPPIHHMGLVVHDIDKAVEHYTRIGLGPFQVFEMEFPDFVYHGKLAPHRQKFGFSSTTPGIELMQVLEGETPNADFLKKRGEGIAHLAYFVDVNEFEGILAHLKKEGFEPIYYRLTSDMPIAYFGTDVIGGVMIELIGAQAPDVKIPSEKEGEFRLPAISQIGFAVQDAEKVGEHFERIGLGPFDILDVPLEGFIYNGKPAPHRVKLGFSRTVPQIELIEGIEGDTPNSDFLKQKGEGVTHLQFTVDMDEYEPILDRWAKEGFEPVFYRNEPEMALSYMNADKIGGIMIELMGLKKKE